MAKILADKMLKTANKWKDKIKAHHKYPELKFKGRSLIETPTYRDFEIYAEIIGNVREILEKTIGKEKTEILFENMDNHTKSAYFYSIASDFHVKGDELKATEILDKCIKLNPEEAVFYYMKGHWLMNYVTIMESLGELENEERRKLKESTTKNVKKAAELAPDWREAKKLLEEVLRKNNRLC